MRQQGIFSSFKRYVCLDLEYYVEYRVSNEFFFIIMCRYSWKIMRVIISSAESFNIFCRIFGFTKIEIVWCC